MRQDHQARFAQGLELRVLRGEIAALRTIRMECLL